MHQQHVQRMGADCGSLCYQEWHSFHGLTASWPNAGPNQPWQAARSFCCGVMMAPLSCTHAWAQEPEADGRGDGDTRQEQVQPKQACAWRLALALLRHCPPAPLMACTSCNDVSLRVCAQACHGRPATACAKVGGKVKRGRAHAWAVPDTDYRSTSESATSGSGRSVQVRPAAGAPTGLKGADAEEDSWTSGGSSEGARSHGRPVQ